MLKGEDKKEYQREYMRKRRALFGPSPKKMLDPRHFVRPKPQEDVRPKARYEPGRIGIPIKPTQAQKAEWARFKQGKST